MITPHLERVHRAIGSFYESTISGIEDTRLVERAGRRIKFFKCLQVMTNRPYCRRRPAFSFQFFALLLFISLFLSPVTSAQLELLPANHPVYKFLLRQQMRGTIHGFSWGMLPLSRRDVARFLSSLKSSTDELSSIDRMKLDDYDTEFEYDMHKSLQKASPLLPDFSLGTLFDNERQKYLAAYDDSVASIFIDGFGSLSYRTASGDSVGSPFISLGELGFRIRGTLFDRIGFYLQASNGLRLGGDAEFGKLENRLKANTIFNEGEKHFDFTTGYLQYDADWLRLTLGREQLLWGTGYADRLILSNNTVPFDFWKIDLSYKSVHYSFFHGSLVGDDSLGRQLTSKYLATHRLEFDLSQNLRIGISEMLVYSNRPVDFTYLNPLIFMTSADLSSEHEGRSNALIGIDVEVLPMKNFRVVGTLLIDDLNFETLGLVGNELQGNDNKFGWQGGILWTDALNIQNLSMTTEYARVNPFVYSHRTMADSYSQVNLPLGHSLQPNSDEWLLGFGFDVNYRLSLGGQIRLQRAGENLVDSLGRIVYNAGSNILRGDGDVLHPNVFLDGRRVNRSLASLEIVWQPIKQYFLEIKYFYRSFNFLSDGRKLTDSIFWTTVRVDY